MSAVFCFFLFFFIYSHKVFIHFFRLCLQSSAYQKKKKKQKARIKQLRHRPLGRQGQTVSELRRYRNCCCAIEFPGRRIKELPGYLLEYMFAQGREQMARQTVDKHQQVCRACGMSSVQGPAQFNGVSFTTPLISALPLSGLCRYTRSHYYDNVRPRH